MKLDQIFKRGKESSILTIKDGAANFIVSLILMFIFQFIVTIVLMITNVDYSSFVGTVAYSCIVCFINEMAFLVTPLSYSKVVNAHFVKDIKFKKGVSLLQVILLIAIAIFTLVFSSPIANYFVKFILWTGFDISKLSLLSIKTGEELIAALVFIALIPSICEEILYRGIIARSFKSKNVIFAIFMSAFFFAIMHGTPIQLVHQFVIGVVCCVVYFITKSIYAPIIVHFSNNALTLIGGYVEYKMGADGVIDDWIMIIMIIVGAIALPFFVYLLYKKSTKVQYDKLKSFKENMEDICKFDYELEQEEKDRLAQNELMAKMESAEMAEVLKQEMKTRSSKSGLIGRRALIYAIILGMAIWIIQTLMCYI